MSRSDIDRALMQFDFEEFLLSNGVSVENKGDEMAGTCPLCNWRRQSFYVSLDIGKWICHKCGEKGNGVSLIQRVLNISYKAALEKLTKNFVIFLPEEREIHEPKVASISLPPEYVSLAAPENELSAPYLRYLHGRGVDDRLIAIYRIGYCLSGRYDGRVIIPVTRYGKLTSFVARAIVDSKRIPKVDTPWSNEQAQSVFNLDNLWGTEELVVMEGVFDALTLPEMAVATLGKKISDAQVNLLRKSGARSLIFCYDEDAREESIKFGNKWSFSFRTKWLPMPPGNDPSKLGREEMLARVPQAEGLTGVLANLV